MDVAGGCGGRGGTYNSPHVVHADARLLEAVPALQAEQLTARPSLYVPPSGMFWYFEVVGGRGRMMWGKVR